MASVIRICPNCHTLTRKAACETCFTGEGGNYPSMSLPDLLSSIERWKALNWPGLSDRVVRRREKTIAALLATQGQD